MTKNDGVSILAGLVSDTMSKVESKPKRELTALAGESGASDPLPFTPAPFPHDRPSEAIAHAIKDIDRAIAELTTTRDALQLLATPAVESKTDKIAEQQKAEAAADKRASVNAALDDSQKGYSPEQFRVLQQEAQAATFSEPEPEPNIAREVPSGTGWTCPDHGEAKTVSSAKGRRFTICPTEGCKNRQVVSGPEGN